MQYAWHPHKHTNRPAMINANPECPRDTAPTACLVVQRRPDIARRRELYDLVRKLALGGVSPYDAPPAAEHLEAHAATR